MHSSTIVVAIILFLLPLWGLSDCARNFHGDIEHLQVFSLSNQKADDIWSHTSNVASKLPKRSLMTFGNEDYSDLHAPPRLSKPQHGPVVFNHKKKGPKPSPSSSLSQAQVHP